MFFGGVEMSDQEGECPHQNGCRQYPDKGRQQSQTQSAPFVPYQSENLSAGSTGEQLAESVEIEQFLFRHVSPSLDEGSVHHPKMALWPAESGDCMEEDGLHKGDVPLHFLGNLFLQTYLPEPFLQIITRRDIRVILGVLFSDA